METSNKIKVRWNKNYFSLDRNTLRTIADLKLEIKKRSQVQTDEQKMIFKGKVLKDDELIEIFPSNACITMLGAAPKEAQAIKPEVTFVEDLTQEQKMQILREKGEEIVFGLNNLGNTCYLNSTIQCLGRDNLTAARRINQLETKDFLTMNIDYKQAPIGTATCGPGVDEKYVIGNQVYEYTVLLCAFDKTQDPIELTRFQVPDATALMVPTPEIKAKMLGDENFRMFNRPLTISMTCADPKAEIRYTKDGSEPTLKSSVFSKPFIILKTATIKAKAFKKGSVPSFVALRQFERLNIKGTTFVNPPAERYGKDADIALMDGKKGVSGDWHNDWLGFEGVDMEATIELAVPTRINTVKIGLCHEPNDWVMWPKSVWVSFSKDGKEFTDWQMAELPVFVGFDKMQGFGRIEARLRTDGKQWKYVRVKVENQGTLPEWHPYKGQKAWIMVDEVMIE